MARTVLLAQNQGNDATGDTLTWDGGEAGFFVQGTWGGASATLQAAPNAPQTGITLTPQDTDVVATSAEPYISCNHIPSGKVRVVTSGGDATTSLTAILARR
jgi:hypothetical protein